MEKGRKKIHESGGCKERTERGGNGVDGQVLVEDEG